MLSSTESRDVKNVDHVVQPNVARDSFLVTVERVKKNLGYRGNSYFKNGILTTLEIYNG